MFKLKNISLLSGLLFGLIGTAAGAGEVVTFTPGDRTTAEYLLTATQKLVLRDIARAVNAYNRAYFEMVKAGGTVKARAHFQTAEAVLYLWLAVAYDPELAIDRDQILESLNQAMRVLLSSSLQTSPAFQPFDKEWYPPNHLMALAKLLSGEWIGQERQQLQGLVPEFWPDHYPGPQAGLNSAADFRHRVKAAAVLLLETAFYQPPGVNYPRFHTLWEANLAARQRDLAEQVLILLQQLHPAGLALEAISDAWRGYDANPLPVDRFLRALQTMLHKGRFGDSRREAIMKLLGRFTDGTIEVEGLLLELIPPVITFPAPPANYSSAASFVSPLPLGLPAAFPVQESDPAATILQQALKAGHREVAEEMVKLTWQRLAAQMRQEGLSINEQQALTSALAAKIALFQAALERGQPTEPPLDLFQRLGNPTVGKLIGFDEAGTSLMIALSRLGPRQERRNLFRLVP